MAEASGSTATAQRGVARVLAPMLADERPPLRRAPHAALLALVAGAWFGGLFERAELALMDLRMRAVERPAGGELVVLEAEGAAPAKLAAALDRALAAGARQVAFSHPVEADGAFAAALARAADRAVLALPESPAAEAPAQPRRRFGAVAAAPGADGRVRDFPVWTPHRGEMVPALPVALLGVRVAGAPAAPAYDFSIRAESLPRLGLDEALAGGAGLASVAGKDVLIASGRAGEALAATAQGRLPRAELLALGYETLAQKRWIGRSGALETLGVSAALALLLGPWFARLSWRRGLMLACAAPAAFLSASLFAQAQWAVSLDLAPWLLLPLLGWGWEAAARLRLPKPAAVLPAGRPSVG